MGGEGHDQELRLPDDVVAALKAQEGGWTAFEEFPREQAKDLMDWIEAADGPEHRTQRIAMIVELVTEHFAKLKRIDLTEETTRNND